MASTVDQAANEHEKSALPPAYQQAPPPNFGSPLNPPQYHPGHPSHAHYTEQPSYQQASSAPSVPAPQLTYSAHYIVQQPGTYVYQTQPQTLQTGGQQNLTIIQADTSQQDYFTFSLFVMLCCCLPLGIVAIVKSGDVKKEAALGNMAGARMASTEAKRYAWIGCIIGIILWVIGIVVMSIWIAYQIEDCGDGYC